MRRAAVAIAVLLSLAACADAPPPPGEGWVAGAALRDPPTANRAIDAALRAELQRPVAHPADGGGRAWLALEPGDDGSVAASETRSWRFVYEAGPLGIAPGGALLLQVSPFWNWSTPQPLDASRPGYTTVATDAEGLVLRAETVDAQLLAVFIEGRALAEGERVHLHYGAGAQGARADRYAEGRSWFRFAVDGDGDGQREWVADAPSVTVRPGPAAQLALTLTSTARPGGTVRLTVAVLDEVGNGQIPWAGLIELQPSEGLQGESYLSFAPEHRGARTIELLAGPVGVYRVLAQSLPDGQLVGLSNPLLVTEDARPILWGDLHGHSDVSDGTGTPEDYYLYARDIAALDVASLTDHDHWGLPFLDRSPATWDAIIDATRAVHAPGRFVSLLGFEWTSWVHGHRHVLYFEDEGPLLSSLDEATSTPGGLAAALAGRPALLLAHHSGGGPVPCDWTWPPDPQLEPVTEIMSVHGSSEALDSPRLIYNALPGNFARDALDRGYRLGFIGSGDGHDGHPGLTRLGEPSGHGGLAAILAEEATRASVLEALRARRTYATSGPRIVLRAALDGRPMGSEVPPGDGRLVVVATGTTPIERIELIRGGRVVRSAPVDGDIVQVHAFDLQGLAAGEYVYVRVVQAGEGLAWTSPWFVGGEAER